ncbi:hypothetical protein B484DRAFT_256422 [Ochromonadaceae sp. CCMP2298]|nr:hypothetical protein B484DRAFT_256422 [Ochromonadaceae sp. CCMP2298]
MDDPANFIHLYSAPVTGITVRYSDSQSAGNRTEASAEDSAPTYFGLDPYVPFVAGALGRNLSESAPFNISSLNVTQVRRLENVERETEHVEQEWVGGSGKGAGAAPGGPPVYVPGGCAEGWTVGKTKCYLFVPQTYSRDACTAFCQSQVAVSHTGTQISPLSGGLCAQSQEEAEFLTLHSAYSDSVAGSWLNYDRDASGVWRWGKGCARSSYEQWSAAAPVSSKTFRSWIGAYSLSHYRGASGDWNNADPSSQQHCSCETPQHTPVASCPLGWVQGPEHCYHLDPDYEKAPKKTWEECRDACADMGADMLCIRSQGEQDFLGGLRSSPRSDYYTLWVGVTGQEGGGYGWEEGCDSTYR